MNIKNLYEKIINIIAFFFIITGILSIIAISVFIIGTIFYEPLFTAFIGFYPNTIYVLILNSIIAIFSIIVGIGLLSRMHYARIGAILLSIPKILTFPVGTIIGITIIILLVLPYANKIFGKFLTKNIPYRAIGFIITIIGFISFSYFTGYAQNTYQTLSIELFGFPQYNINPMEKIKLDDLYGEKDIIVELTAPVGKYAIQQQDIVIQQINSLGGFVEDRYYYVFNGLHVKIDGNKLKELASNPYIKAIYPNTKINLYFGEITDVYCLDDCNNLLNTEWLWNNGFTGKGVVVAVIDSGINEDMEWLQRNGSSVVIASYEKYCDYLISPDYNYINHGTLVASCIASQHPTYKGVSPDVYLIDVEVFTVDENGNTVSYEADILWGYDKVAEFKQENPEYFVITSCSFGYPAELLGDTWSNPTPMSAGANNLALFYNIPVVASAGNDAPMWRISSPASAQYVLGVGAVDKYFSPASFSSEGPTPDGHKKPDVSNVGVSVATFDYDGSLKYVSGTSFSCPLTSGIIANLATKYNDLKSIDFYYAIKKSADDLYINGFDYKTGYGFVDGVEASQILDGITPAGFWELVSLISIFIGIGIVFYPEWSNFGIEKYERRW